MEKKKTVLMLISETHKLFVNQVRSKADENNLCNCYHPIIFHLIHHDGLTQLDLVRLTRLKAPTISLTLQKMEQEGFVKRVQSQEDARKTLVYLTDKGKLYDAKMIEIIEGLENQILKKLDQSEINELERILHKLIKAMCEEFGEYQNENI